MKIAVIGAGAIGSVIAAYLTKAGCDVVLIAKPNQIAAIEKNGLTISGVRGKETFKPRVLPKLDREYDLVIFTVKTQDMEDAYIQNHVYLEDHFVLTTQNGVQADNLLSCHLEREKIISSVVMFGATYTKPGEVTLNFEGDWIIGKPYVLNGPEVLKITEILKKAFKVTVSHDIMGMKWLKLFVNFNNCLPALVGRSMQETFSDLDFCKLSILLLKEGVEVTQKARIELVSLPAFPKEKILGLTSMPIDQAAGVINKTLTTLSKEPLYGSILQSIMRKRNSEIDYINGEVVALAKQTSQRAPLNGKIVDLVHEVESKGKFFNPEDIKREFSLINV